MRRFLSFAVFVVLVLAVGMVLYPDQTSATGELLLIGTLAAAPTIALYGLPAYALYRLWPQLRVIGALLAAFAIVLSLGAAYNAYRSWETGRLIASNTSEPVARLRGPFVLARQDTLGDQSSTAYCDDLCLRMLLKQNASSYANITVSGPEDLLSLADREIPSLAIRKLAGCPGIAFSGDLRDNGEWYVSPDEMKTIWSVNPQFQMKTMEQSGTCLTEDAVSFADVDTVVYVGRDKNNEIGRQRDWLVRPTPTRTIDIYQRVGGKLKRVFRTVAVFSDRLVLPPVFDADAGIYGKFHQVLEAFKIQWRPGGSMRSNDTRLLRQTRNDVVVPSVYSVIAEQLGMPLELEQASKAKLSDNSKEKSRILPPENLSARFAKMVAQQTEDGTNFSAQEIQEFMDGFRGVHSSALLPNFTIHRLLKNQRQSEITILKALLNSMRKEHRAEAPNPAIPQNSLVVKLADSLPLFSDIAIKASAPEFDALEMTPRQIGSMPDLAGAIGILGKSRLPILEAIVDGYAQRNLKANRSGDDYFQYLSALQGLCAMGRDASGVLPRLNKMGERGQLLTGRDPTGASTLIMLLRLGARPEDYRPVFNNFGWTNKSLDAIASEIYVTADCMDLNRGRSILIRHPLIEVHWPFVSIRENATTKF